MRLPFIVETVIILAYRECSDQISYLRSERDTATHFITFI